jgi:hypothetical protein
VLPILGVVHKPLIKKVLQTLGAISGGKYREEGVGGETEGEELVAAERFFLKSIVGRLPKVSQRLLV